MSINLIYKILISRNFKSKHYIKRYIRFIIACKWINENSLVDKNIEKHHIIPVSFNPELSKEHSNIIVLTPRQHFIAHWILARAYGSKMWFAFHRMCYSKSKYLNRDYNISSRIYEELRRNIPKPVHTEESKAKISAAKKGVKLTSFRNPMSEEGRNNIRISMLGRKQPKEQCEKRSDSISKLKWFNNGVVSKRLPECPKGWSTGRLHSFKGQYQPKASEETKLKMKETANKRPRFPCSKCGRLITKSNLQKHEKSCVTS